MPKRAIDLTWEELAVLGANAALEAAQDAQAAGLSIVGAVNFQEKDRLFSVLAEREPSGKVSLVNAADRVSDAQIDTAQVTKPPHSFGSAN